MRPFKHPDGLTFGRRTYRWRLRCRKLPRRQHCRVTSAHWPIALYSRYVYDEEQGYEPYPEPDTDTYMVVYWRRRPHRLPHVAQRSPFRLAWAELYTRKHLDLIRRARRFWVPQFSKWHHRAVKFHRGY